MTFIPCCAQLLSTYQYQKLYCHHGKWFRRHSCVCKLFRTCVHTIKTCFPNSRYINLHWVRNKMAGMLHHCFHGRSLGRLAHSARSKCIITHSGADDIISSSERDLSCSGGPVGFATLRKGFKPQPKRSQQTPAKNSSEVDTTPTSLLFSLPAPVRPF